MVLEKRVPEAPEGVGSRLSSAGNRVGVAKRLQCRVKVALNDIIC
jgi:hypothetical protein